MTTPKLDDVVERALEESGVPWTIENGGKHFKIKVGGRLVGVVPKGRRSSAALGVRAAMNTASQIRRTAKMVRETKNEVP